MERARKSVGETCGASPTSIGMLVHRAVVQGATRAPPEALGGGASLIHGVDHGLPLVSLPRERCLQPCSLPRLTSVPIACSVSPAHDAFPNPASQSLPPPLCYPRAVPIAQRPQTRPCHSTTVLVGQSTCDVRLCSRTAVPASIGGRRRIHVARVCSAAKNHGIEQANRSLQPVPDCLSPARVTRPMLPPRLTLVRAVIQHRPWQLEVGVTREGSS